MCISLAYSCTSAVLTEPVLREVKPNIVLIETSFEIIKHSGSDALMS